MNRAVIGVGSNINPQDNIPRAIRLLEQQFTILKKSNFIETEPIGYSDQPNFINGVVVIQTNLSINQLKQKLAHIEHQLCRSRTENRYGPRTIDLDIIIWNSHIVDDDVYERDFLKSAIVEVLPELIPVLSNKPRS